MAQYQLIRNGVVVNRIEADAEFVASIASQYDSIELVAPAALPSALEVAVTARYAAIEQAYGDALALGVTVGELTLAAGPADQVALGQGLTILTAALLAQAIDNNALVSGVFGRLVTDAAGAGHDMSAGAYVTLSLGYAAAIGTLQARRTTALAAIDAASTVEAVNAVTF